MDYKKRVGKLRQYSGKLGAILVTSPEDILYYTGYPSHDNGFLLITKSKSTLFVSPLENDAEKLKTVDVEYLGKGVLTNKLKGKIVGFDESSLTSDLFLSFRKSGIKLKPISSQIRKPRQVKDHWEIEQIKSAIRITKEFVGRLELLNRTERQVAFSIDSKMRDLGVTNSFDTIVGSGSNAASIHHMPDNRKIMTDDVVIVDLGVKYNGYCSDITRTFSQKNQKWKRIKEDVKEIQMSIIDSVAVGTKMKDLQGLYEKLMKKRGYKVCHYFGHGIGLSVHESVDVLEENMVITVEPGVYIKNSGGCRIEDMILVTRNKPKILSDFIL